MTILGHLGPRVSDLLDDRLDEHTAAAAWAHVDGCPSCRSDVETEAWVKRTLSSLGSLGDRCTPERLRGRLAQDALIASYADAPAWARDAQQPDDRGHRWTVAAIGGGALTAAMLAVVALGAVPSSDPVPDRRLPASIADAPRDATSTPATPTTDSPRSTTPSPSATTGAESGEDRTAR